MDEYPVLKAYLLKHHLTVREFAQLAGLNKRSLDVYVSGAKSFEKSQLWFALRVADAMHIDPHELLQHEEN